MKHLFLQETYYTEDYPSSVANVMFNINLIGNYFCDGGDKDDNIKLYIKWIREKRDELFPRNTYKKTRKFVQVYGLKRSMTIKEAFDKFAYHRKGIED